MLLLSGRGTESGAQKRLQEDAQHPRRRRWIQIASFFWALSLWEATLAILEQPVALFC